MERAGTRNYIGILTSVNCSGSVAKFIAEAAEKIRDCWTPYPNVDGIVPIVHGTGCGMSAKDEGYATLFRTLSGYAQHPNFAAILLIGLGCEVMQIADLVGDRKIRPGGDLRYMTIQQTGWHTQDNRGRACANCMTWRPWPMQGRACAGSGL